MEQIFNPYEHLIRKIDSLIKTVNELSLRLENKEKEIEIIDRRELAKRLSVTQRTILNIEARGVIKPIRFGRVVRYNWSDFVNQWVEDL